MKVFSFIEKLKSENKLLTIAVLALVIVVAGEGAMLYKMSDDKTVIVLPPAVDKEFWVAGDNVSGAYLEQVAFYLADRILTVSPENVDASLSSIYPFLSTEPADLKKVKDILSPFSSSIKKENFYQSFYPMKFYQSKDSKLIVEGIIRKSSGQMYVGEEKRQISFFYAMRKGRLSVKEVVLQ